MKPKTKTLTMAVTVSVPHWLTAAQARKELRELVKEQRFWGHQNPRFNYDVDSDQFEIDGGNFRLVSVKPA